jgi:hypothetical protein
MQLIENKNMDKKIRKGKVRMGKGMCWKGVTALKIKDLNENQIF